MKKWLTIFQVQHYWEIRREQDLNKVVSVIGDSTLTQYNIKLLDEKKFRSSYASDVCPKKQFNLGKDGSMIRYSNINTV